MIIYATQKAVKRLNLPVLSALNDLMISLQSASLDFRESAVQFLGWSTV